MTFRGATALPGIILFQKPPQEGARKLLIPKASKKQVALRRKQMLLTRQNCGPGEDSRLLGWSEKRKTRRCCVGGVFEGSSGEVF